MRAILFSILLVGAAACGNKSKPAAGPDTAGHNEEEHSASEEAAMTPELKTFHDEFAPIWHSQGPDRQTNACQAAGDMLELGAKIQDAGAPEGAAADWGDRVTAFMVAIDHMKEGCQNDSQSFDADFTAVHEDFHALLDALPKG